MNILVGENNSGKTSALEAIAFLCRPIDPDIWIQLASKREPPISGEAPLDSIKWFFPHVLAEGRQTWSEIGLSCEGDVAAKELTANYIEMRALRRGPLRGADQALSSSAYVPAMINQVPMRQGTIELSARLKDGATKSFSQGYWEDEPLTLREERPEPQLPMDIVAAHDHRLTGFVALKLGEATRAGRIQDALKLAQCTDPEIESVSFEGLSVRPGVYITTKRAGLQPLSSFGDATRRAVLIGLMMPQAANGVFLLDEIETSLYKTASKPVLSQILQAAKEQNVQLFATTHGLEAMDAILDSVDEKDLAVYRMVKNEKETIEIHRTPGRITKEQRVELGLDIR